MGSWESLDSFLPEGQPGFGQDPSQEGLAGPRVTCEKITWYIEE